MNKPSVSVVVPTYNRAMFVCLAIESILAQTFTDHEIVIVDDGSTDDTRDVLASFGERIRYVHQENSGVSAARNLGVRHATADLIAFLDSDDRWEPEKLERQVPLMDRSDVVLSASNWSYEASSKRAFDDLELNTGNLRFDDPLTLLSRFEGHRLWLPTWIVRRSAFIRVGGFDERMRVAEDSRLLFRMAFEGAFCLTDYVGTIRSSSVDAEQLTLANDFAYRRRLTPLTLELLCETYIRASGSSVEVQRRLRKLLGYFLRNHSEHLLLDGNSMLARRRAIEALAMAPRFKDALAALAVLVFPPVVRWNYRNKDRREDS